MKGKRILRCALILLLAVLIFHSQAIAADEDYPLEGRKITGYYYDPVTGKVIPKFDNLSPTEVNFYLWCQAHAKEINAVRKLNYKKFNTVSVEYIKFLTTQQIASIPNTTWFLKLSDAQRAALTAKQIQAINTAKVSIGALTMQQREQLTPLQIQTVKYQDFQYVPVSKITDLTTQQISSIPSSSWFVKLSEAQRAAFSTPQVQAINTAKISISYIPSQKREDLTTTQIQRISNYRDFQYVPVSKIPSLTTTQIASIPNTASFNKFSDDQVHALTKSQVLAIPKAYYNKIKARLTPEQRSWRP